MVALTTPQGHDLTTASVLRKRKRNIVDLTGDEDDNSREESSAHLEATTLTQSPSASRTCPQHLVIFHNLYCLLRLDAHLGFDKFTTKYTELDVLQIIDRSFRFEVKQLMASEKYTNKDSLLVIRGDVRYKGLGWYMDVIIDENDICWFKLYIGQGERVKFRVDYHSKPSVKEKNSALHYRLARKPARRSNYVLLVSFPEGEDLDTQLLDVVEMYLGLLFQALPPKTLRKYLPQDADLRQPERGCMVANPLNQHHDDEAARRASCQLRDSTDPEIREHYKDACDYLKTVEYRPSMAAMRDKSKKKDLFRGATNEFERVVHIRCNTCKADVAIKQDPLPLFDKESGKYLIRQQSCFNCKVPGAKKGDRRQFKSTMFYPIDGRPTMSMSWLGKHAKEPKSTNQYVSNGS
ncbi:hypothetical protein LTR37_019884 [Vermiconidia calcicola]|uniref:Uncharacterized protein n=1 Tax=Vermiconidia calcicola TaxID=1690605 RepID=A0ACC3ME40_9PEZI|nr:hypothetical protein LTR37_019884 [Vermiconidia calcicola]